jgi:23S rRNA (adenine2030-N6)-methyltransferase
MLSYRHGFHAGNAADVLKHTVLAFCLDYLTRKDKPLLCVDTHAGAGSYPLADGFSALKREWKQGLGKLLRAGTALPSPLRRYLELCGADTGSGVCAIAAPPAYPGSPLIMARLLRPADRLVCFELHGADYAACASLLQDRAEVRCRTEVRREDGFSGLMSLLPPPSRRGLVLIDPPYELKDDYGRVIETAARALRRFSGGTYIIWYPLHRNPPPGCGAGEALPARLMELYAGNRCRVELYTASPESPPSNSPRGMYGSGLVIYNPPWTLRPALEECLPVLGSLLGTGADSWGWGVGCGEEDLTRRHGGTGIGA